MEPAVLILLLSPQTPQCLFKTMCMRRSRRRYLDSWLVPSCIPYVRLQALKNPPKCQICQILAPPCFWHGEVNLRESLFY